MSTTVESSTVEPVRDVQWLDCLDEGARITVAGVGETKVWVKEGTWWRMADGTTALDSATFGPALAAGAVTLAPMTVAVGDALDAGAYTYLVTAAGTDPSAGPGWWTVRFIDGERYRVRFLSEEWVQQRVEAKAITHISPVPEYMRPFASVVVPLVQAMAEQATAAAVAPPRWPEGFVEAIQAHASEEEDTELNDLLSRFDIAVAMDVEVTVDITGHTDWTPEPEDAWRYVGGEVTVTEVNDSVTIYWSRQVTITKRGLGCQCEQVERGDLYDYVPDNYSDFDYETSCSGD